MIKDFNEFKAEKEGIVTPKAVIENILIGIEKGWVDDIVVVVRTHEGSVTVGASNQDTLAILGLLEAGKFELINDLYSEWNRSFV